MKTFTFSTNGDNQSSMVIHGLPNRFESIGNRQFIKVESNNDADIIIEDRISMGQTHLGYLVGSGVLTFYHWRLLKHFYNKMLNAGGKVNGNGVNNLFIPLNVWEKPDFCEYDKRSEFLLRSQVGARGLGFISKRKNSKYSWSTIILEVNKFANAHDETLEHLQQKLESLGAYLTVKNLYKDQDDMRNILSGMQLVERVNNIIFEFRVLTDYEGKPALYIRRDLEEVTTETSFYQPNNDPWTTKEIEPNLSHYKFNSELVNQIEKHIKGMNMPLHSFDLFITEQFKYGFFEASNEFCKTCPPDGWLTRHSQLLMYKLSKHLE